jgi:protein PhnA
MNDSKELPPCPKCKSSYVYEDRDHYVCPECGHEWAGSESIETDAIIVKDANGNRLHEGDYVILIKDLKVKGSSSVAKIGTKVKIIHLVEGDHNIDCKIEGIGPMMLKSEFVKKA